MRKRIILIFLVLLLILVSLCSCETKAKYEFLYSPTEIKEIQIVIVGEEGVQGEIEQEVICRIDDMDAFLYDLSRLDCYCLYTDPAGVERNQTAIKIEYNNHCYELISYNGKAQYIDGRFKNYVGYRYFDEEPFQNLINKYIKNAMTMMAVH